MKKILVISSIGLLAVCWAVAQQSQEVPSWAPKPVEASKYKPPMKPHTKIAEVLAKHKGESNWREPVVRDDHFDCDYVMMASGTKVSPRFHPDTRAWWIVRDGQVRYNIEGQESFVATKNSMVQVPLQTIFSMEVVGDKPALVFEVNIARAKTLFPQENKPEDTADVKYIPVVLRRKAHEYLYNNKPHINLFELAKDPKYTGSRFVHDDRGVSNIIYGEAKNLPPYNPKNRGHYHTECAEFWLVMLGQIQYPIEGVGNIIASEGDVVYVPPFTFHAPRFYGDGPSCRLAINGYPDIAHLFDAPERPH